MAEALDIRSNPYKADFPLLANNPELVFLDSAATAQRPSVVLDAQRRFYETMNANPLRGLYKLSVEATQVIDDARAHIARFIGAHSGSEIVFGRNASEMLNLCASGLEQELHLSEGDEICISIMEHHSNLIPWQQVCARTGAKLVFLRPNEYFELTSEEIAAKIGPKTKVVSVTQLSNVLGCTTPVRELADAAHAVGATLVVDGAQGLPHLPVNVEELGCDLYVFSAHKLMGPMGIGVLWGKPELLDAFPPFLTGGEMIDAVYETHAVWAPVPTKFEAGTQDAAGIYATDAALSYFEGIGHETLMQRERALVDYTMQCLSELPFITIIGPSEAQAHVGVVSFNVNGIHPHDVASIVDSKNVCIRAGHHCAQPLLAWLGVENGACCRASLAFYNDANDVDQLISALEFVWSIFNG